MNDKFINVLLKDKNLDIFFIRNSIFKCINENILNFNGKLLDIGCGQMPYRELIEKNSDISSYTGIDLEDSLDYVGERKPDLRWKGTILPFDDNEFNTILLTEVLEHTPNPQLTIKECYRVLDIDGLVFFTVPFLWPLHEVPRDEYRYTPFALERIFKEAGFKNIEIKATGGWHASLAQILGLWVRRSGISNGKRKYLSLLLKPIIRFLIRRDKIPQDFQEGQMITGLCGIAKKTNL